MLTLFAPAKVNLFLKIINKRQDGFHDIASLFQAITLGDTMVFSFSEKDKYFFTNPNIPTDSTNLVMKAVDLFRRKTLLSFGVDIFVDKRIPCEAGLGGGSSNAATTLFALNKLCNYPVKLGDLIDWSGEIGSDVPFFLSQGTAYCTGRGEKMAPYPELDNIDLYIIKPIEGISTAKVYRNFSLAHISNICPKNTAENFLKGEFRYFNDLEDTACALLPSLNIFRKELKKCGFDSVTMSGSGTSFFCTGKPVKELPKYSKHFNARFLRRRNNEWYH